MSAHQTLAEMMAAYAAKSAALTAAYDAECNAPPTAEDIAHADIRRAEITSEQIRRAEIAEDNEAAIAALDLLTPLTAEQIEKLPHSKRELVDCKTPKFGVVLKSHWAHRNTHSNRQSLIEWVAVVKTHDLTSEMVKSLGR
jgi:hypothetical protein